MKKTAISLIFASLVLTSAFAMAGCGSSGSSAAEATTAAATEAQQVATTAAQDAAVIDPSDAVFTYNGVSLELNSSIDDMLASLGEANSVESQMSCHGVGEDKTYIYDSFTVNSYPLDGKDMVMEVLINTPGVPTSKGIEVGSTVDQVTAAYGDSFKEVGIYYSYSAGDNKALRFCIEDGTVTEIDYYYTV